MSMYPPAKPEALRRAAPQRGQCVILNRGKPQPKPTSHPRRRRSPRRISPALHTRAVGALFVSPALQRWESTQIPCRSPVRDGAHVLRPSNYSTRRMKNRKPGANPANTAAPAKPGVLPFEIVHRLPAPHSKKRRQKRVPLPPYP